MRLQTQPSLEAQRVALMHPMFESMTPEEARLIFSLLQHATYDPSEVIFTEGAPGNQCFFLVAGGVLVSKRFEEGREQQLATLKPGDTFGEIALIDRKPRSATCRAGREGCQLLTLTTDAFERLFSAQSPFAYKVLDHVVVDLAKRLRGATDQLRRARLASTSQQRDTLSLRASQMLNARYSNEELDAVQVVRPER